MKISKKMRAFIVLLAIFFAVICYSVLSITAFSDNDEWIKADAAIVLGAAAWGERPSPVFKERINHALWLYKMGYVKKIIFTGAKGSSNEPPESIVAMRYAMRNGVPAGDILVEEKSRTTQENLYYAREIAIRNDLKTFLIVSDPLHMKRAMMMARKMGMTAYHSPTPTSRYRGWWSRLKFLAREAYFFLRYKWENAF